MMLHGLQIEKNWTLTQFGTEQNKQVLNTPCCAMNLDHITVALDRRDFPVRSEEKNEMIDTVESNSLISFKFDLVITLNKLAIRDSNWLQSDFKQIIVLKLAFLQ
jgi:hypothetical protein